jgi:tetratricopeptide (TPR) repeat protein
MNQRRSHPRMRPKARAEKYLDRAGELYGFSDSNPALLREALITAKKSLLLNPENYETFVLLGNIYSDFDDPKSTAQALRYYDQAITLRPEGPGAYDAKAGLLMYWLDQPEEAERLARKALALSLRTGEVSESLEYELSLIALESCYTTLIDILVGRKKYAQARWLIRRALRDCPSENMRGIVEQPLKEIGSSGKRTHDGTS